MKSRLIFNSFIIVLLCAIRISAQPNIRLIKVNTQFPVKLTTHLYGSYKDTSYTPQDSIIRLSPAFDTAMTQITVHQLDDTIFFRLNEPMPNWAEVNIILDSDGQTLKYLYLNQNYMHIDQIDPFPSSNTYSVSSTIVFINLPYTITNDSILQVKSTGLACKQKISMVHYSDKYEEYHYDPRVPTDKIKETYSNTLYDDTIAYSLNATFIVHLLRKNSVYPIPSKNTPLHLLQLINNKIILQFFACGNCQPFTIYDLLGREISRIVIPAGTTQYTLDTSGFPSGHYFARLGNMTGHFVVY